MFRTITRRELLQTLTASAGATLRQGCQTGPVDDKLSEGLHWSTASEAVRSQSQGPRQLS